MQSWLFINDEPGYEAGQDAYHWIEGVLDTHLGQHNSPCLQNYSSVQTRQGARVSKHIARSYLPSHLSDSHTLTSQHRVSPFRLIDTSKSGHRRFIALWLVDPTIRITSTGNVPPQQMSWYVDALLGSTCKARNDALTETAG